MPPLRHGCEAERFLSWVTFPPSGCWTWSGKQTNDGYGLFKGADRKTHPAHRWAYKKFAGPITVGLEIDHLCHVRNCVNPKHMEPVTRAENAFRARKAECKQGHALLEGNLYYRKNGLRQCKECVRRSTRERQLKRKTSHAM